MTTPLNAAVMVIAKSMVSTAKRAHYEDLKRDATGEKGERRALTRLINGETARLSAQTSTFLRLNGFTATGLKPKSK